MKILGIDEAGRGPVIGPLVIAGVMITPKQEENLKNIGVKDSKDLSQLQRERMFDSIADNFEHEIIIVSPKEIDDALADENTNLNWLEADVSIKIIKKLNPDKAILDAPSSNPDKYKAYVANKVKTNIVAEHKADSTYPVVSAASILAKVTRDRLIQKIKKEIGQDIGSGYPSDPITKKFIEKNWNKYDIFRKSWETYKKIADKKNQSSLSDF